MLGLSYYVCTVLDMTSMHIILLHYFCMPIFHPWELPHILQLFMHVSPSVILWNCTQCLPACSFNCKSLKLVIQSWTWCSMYSIIQYSLYVSRSTALRHHFFQTIRANIYINPLYLMIPALLAFCVASRGPTKCHCFFMWGHQSVWNGIQASSCKVEI